MLCSLTGGLDPGAGCYTQPVRILLASANRGKVSEVRRILGEQGIDVIGLPSNARTTEFETGDTYSANALLKARHYYAQTRVVTLADDSGLEVAALGGAPGVHSARYAAPGATDNDRIEKLLRELDHVPARDRRAAFVCAAAMVWAGGERLFTGSASGVLLTEARGSGGFGFDPVFYYEPLGRTFAELSEDEKARVSHRGQAFRRLALWLRESGLLDTPGMGDRIDDPIK